MIERELTKHFPNAFSGATIPLVRQLESNPVASRKRSITVTGRLHPFRPFLLYAPPLSNHRVAANPFDQSLNRGLR